MVGRTIVRMGVAEQRIVRGALAAGGSGIVCKVYVKPEEGAAYYVINKVSGKLDL